MEYSIYAGKMVTLTIAVSLLACVVGAALFSIDWKWVFNRKTNSTLPQNNGYTKVDLEYKDDKGKIHNYQQTSYGASMEIILSLFVESFIEAAVDRDEIRTALIDIAYQIDKGEK